MFKGNSIESQQRVNVVHQEKPRPKQDRQVFVEGGHRQQPYRGYQGRTDQQRSRYVFHRLFSTVYGKRPLAHHEVTVVSPRTAALGGKVQPAVREFPLRLCYAALLL